MTEPSKVVHVRNVGHEINEALLQMQDIATAVNALQFYTNVQPSIRGRNVYIQFSSHQELTTMEQSAQGRGDEVMDMEYELRALRTQLVEKSKHSLQLQKELAMSKKSVNDTSQPYELYGPEALGAYLRIQSTSNQTTELPACSIQWYCLSSDGKKRSLSQ